MRISLDYDNTYTLDPDCWDKFILLMEDAWHEVICVTMRAESNPVDMICPVYYTNLRGKRDYCLARRLFVDVWIDDRPDPVLCSPFE